LRDRKNQPEKRAKWLSALRVHAAPLCRHQALLAAGSVRLRVAIGRSGVRADKREGDGASPAGRFALGGLWLRGPRRLVAGCGLKTGMTRRDDVWCDDPSHRLYNQAAKAPLKASHEEMWRPDALYDIVIDIRANRAPIRKWRGSAIFLHLSRPGLLATAGCVAIRREDIRKLLPLIGPGTRIEIRSGGVVTDFRRRTPHR